MSEQQKAQQPPIDPYQGLNDPDVRKWIEQNYTNRAPVKK